MGCHTIISLSLVLVHTEQGGNKYLLICQIGQIEIYSESIIINLWWLTDYNMHCNTLYKCVFAIALDAICCFCTAFCIQTIWRILSRLNGWILHNLRFSWSLRLELSIIQHMAVQREKRRTDSLNELPRPLKINSPMTRVLHSAWNPSSPQIPPLYFSSHPPPTSPSGNFPRTVGVFFPLRQVGLNFQGFLNSFLGKSCFWAVSQDFLNSFLVTSFCWEVTWVAFLVQCSTILGGWKSQF